MSGALLRWPRSGDPDVEALIASGWRSSPFNFFLFKVHSRCNLNCDYCYVYHHADQSWRSKPKGMADAIIVQAARRLRSHAERHGLRAVGIGIHGGEPLLIGGARLAHFLEILRGELGPIEARVALQTNGTLITEEIAALCADQRVSVGISVDGDRETHDAHRRDHDGRPSYEATIRGLQVLKDPRFRAAFGPILCTIQLAADPIATYRSLAALGAPGIDFLLPHGHWDAPPPGVSEPLTDEGYADWLIPIFDAWYEERPKRLAIRFFEEILQLMLGGSSGLESVGLAPVSLVVIESDGSIEAVDTLKATFHGAAVTNANVFDNTFDDVLLDPSIVARQIGERALDATCLACSVVKVCGGGYYPHRYRAANGFRNPSVFCASLKKLILHVRGRVLRDIATLRSARTVISHGA